MHPFHNKFVTRGMQVFIKRRIQGSEWRENVGVSITARSVFAIASAKARVSRESDAIAENKSVLSVSSNVQF